MNTDKETLINFINSINSDCFEITREMIKPSEMYHLPTHGGGVTYLRPIHTAEKWSLTINYEV